MIFRVFLNLNRKLLQVKKVTIVQLEMIITKNVTNILKNQLIKKYIFKKYVKGRNEFLMKNDVNWLKWKAYIGIVFNTVKKPLK